METPIQTDFLRWIVFLPLLGAIINGLLGAKIQKSLGKGAISFLACAPVIVAFGLSVQALLALQGLDPAKRFLIDRLYTWIDLGSLKVEMAFLVDPLSAVMILVVTGVGGLIHIYATGYMHDDKGFWRFFAYLNLFTAAMLTLVLGDSLLLLFVGWEGVGLCSWGLIGFWHKELPNTRAGNKAFIVNRVGDFGFVLGIFLLFWALDARGHGTLVFRELREHVHLLEGQALWGVPVATLITLFLFVGVTGKSAQIPLYVWLPDAMAGPTPVSALIHAATMVTAGVYLIARSAPLYMAAPAAQYIVAMIGAVTALFAATIAVGQYDIKKVLAYSTISQLGFMVAGVGMGAFAAGMFHLVTHAFFKALLFLSAGSVILGMERGHHHIAHHGGHHSEEVFDPGDMRNMGGLRKTMPVTFWLYLIGTLALAGIFPFAGFWSKDEILADAFNEGFTAVYWLLTIAAFFTAFYMGRQIWLVFFGKPRHEAAARAEESPKIITVPLMVLAALSIEI